MPGPVGRPAETVRPEVSECSRMPERRRPAARATAPWAPSWAIVTTCRVARQSVGERTSTAAAAAAATRTVGDGSGTVAVTRAQNRPRTSTAPSQPHRPGRPPREEERVAGRVRPPGTPRPSGSGSCDRPRGWRRSRTERRTGIEGWFDAPVSARRPGRRRPLEAGHDDLAGLLSAEPARDGHPRPPAGGRPGGPARALVDPRRFPALSLLSRRRRGVHGALRALTGPGPQTGGPR